MKQSTFFKMATASVILLTGTLSEASKIEAKIEQPESNQQVTSQSLLKYYSEVAQEIKGNTSFYTEDPNKITFFQTSGPQIDVLLTPKRYNELKDENKLDVFVVRENNGRDINTQSIGGVTKSNTKSYIDHVKSLSLSVSEEKTTGDISSKVEYPNEQFPIFKEEISLKELDFKLRKILITKYGLYKEDKSSGNILVHTEDNDKYTFELDKKLQNHRMSDVVQTSNIKKIEVTLKK